MSNYRNAYVHIRVQQTNKCSMKIVDVSAGFFEDGTKINKLSEIKQHLTKINRCVRQSSFRFHKNNLNGTEEIPGIKRDQNMIRVGGFWTQG